MKHILLIHERTSYVSLIRYSVTGPLPVIWGAWVHGLNVLKPAVVEEGEEAETAVITVTDLLKIRQNPVLFVAVPVSLMFNYNNKGGKTYRHTHTRK